ncbi:c-type cytochrome [Tabrizicola sp. M-4]|uniref:c-type cytochrome n=1 Tax=Tabrizicola sp. M-4 TaxID=3055847 RepID=UPI003DA88A93
MKTKLTALAVLSTVLAAPAFAAGDAEAGAKVFNKCQTCHVVANEAGEVLAGRNAKTGPNLYGVVGRAAGTYPEFKYGESIVALGASGYTWTEADLAVYLADPAAFLKDKLGDDKAKSKMVFKLTNETEAANVAAFLASFSAAPAAAEGEAAPAEGEATN